MKISSKVLVGLIAYSLTVSCGKKEDKKKAEEDPEGAISADSIDDLKLSDSFSIKLPEALSGGASASLLALTAKKSSEACMMGNTIREVTRDLSSIGSFFCHLEVEKDKIEFGKKYKIMFQGVEFGRVWADNSKADSGEIALYMCEDGSLKEKIHITSVSDAGPSGTVAQRGSEGNHTWGSKFTFEIGDGKLTLSGQQAFTDSEQGGAFKRDVSLKLDDAGISKVLMSSKGEWNGQDFQDRGAAAFNKDFGSTLFESAGKHDGTDFTFTRTAKFTEAGLVVTGDDNAALFAEGGDLYVASSDLPEYLSTSFAPAAPTGWDCEDVDETIELDPDSAGHRACDGDRDDEQSPDCWGDEFENGQNAE